MKKAEICGFELTEQEYNDAMDDVDSAAVDKLEDAMEALLEEMPPKLVRVGEVVARIHDVALWWRKLAQKKRDFLTSGEYCQAVAGGTRVKAMVEAYLADPDAFETDPEELEW